MEQNRVAPKVVVTGARGFIGKRVVTALDAIGAEVTALVRSGHDKGRLQAAGAKVVVAPLKPGKPLEIALAGHDALINLAYDMRAGMAENLGAFEALIGAATTAGIKRIVHLSSAVVYDGWPGGNIDENSPITDPGDASYRQAKIAMEGRLMGGDFEAAILQPTIVYGPGSALWTTAPMTALTQGGVVLPDPSGACAAVFVDDVAQAIVLAVNVANLGQQRFLISGGQTVPWGEYYGGHRSLLGQGEIILKPVAQLQSALGIGPESTVVSGPSLAAKISAKLRRTIGNRRFEGLVAQARGLHPAKGPNWPDRHMLTLLQATPEISIEKARMQLGYEPKYDFTKGLDAIAADMR